MTEASAPIDGDGGATDATTAPALWFGTVLWLASERRRARLLWLIVGALVLVPVPFLLRG